MNYYIINIYTIYLLTTVSGNHPTYKSVSVQTPIDKVQHKSSVIQNESSIIHSRDLEWRQDSDSQTAYCTRVPTLPV